MTQPKTTSYSIVCESGSFDSVRGQVIGYGLLAVRWHDWGRMEGWAIDHLPTGCRIGTFRTKAEAMRIAKRVERLVADLFVSFSDDPEIAPYGFGDDATTVIIDSRIERRPTKDYSKLPAEHCRAG